MVSLTFIPLGKHLNPFPTCLECPTELNLHKHQGPKSNPSGVFTSTPLQYFFFIKIPVTSFIQKKYISYVTSTTTIIHVGPFNQQTFSWCPIRPNMNWPE